MKRCIFLIAVLLCALLVPNFAQTNLRRKPEQITPIPAQTATKIEPGKLNEETAGIWNDFVSEKYGFRITFPSSSGRISGDESNKFVSFSAATETAEYALTVKSMLVSLNNNQLDAIYESVIGRAEDSSVSRLVSKKDVYLNGVLGKEVVYEEKGRLVFGRFYLLEAKLFVLTVSLPKKDYSRNSNRWTEKFFDSFGVRSNNIDA